MLQNEEIQLINDEDLIGQLSTRKYSITSKGRIRLESKEEMKKRGLRSPDRADAVVLAFAKTGQEVDEDEEFLVSSLDVKFFSVFIRKTGL